MDLTGFIFGLGLIGATPLPQTCLNLGLGGKQINFHWKFWWTMCISRLGVTQTVDLCWSHPTKLHKLLQRCINSWITSKMEPNEPLLHFILTSQHKLDGILTILAKLIDLHNTFITIWTEWTMQRSLQLCKSASRYFAFCTHFPRNGMLEQINNGTWLCWLCKIVRLCYQ